MEVKFFKIEKSERISQKANIDAYLMMQHDGKRDNLTLTNYDYITQSYIANIENEGQQQDWVQPPAALPQGSEVKNLVN